MTRGDSEKNVPVRCEAARVYTVGGGSSLKVRIHVLKGALHRLHTSVAPFYVNCRVGTCLWITQGF